MQKFDKKPGVVLLGLTALLLLSAAVSVCLGRYPISPREAAAILFSAGAADGVQQSLLLYDRLPRIVLALLVGGCLSAAGAAYQSVFQNPMAAPDILGASSGAGFGAALAILLGLGRSGVMGLAFAAGLGAVALVLCIGRRVRGKQGLGLILAGIMVSSLASSATSFLKLAADPAEKLPAITYWLMGSLNGRPWRELLPAAIPMALGLAGLMGLRWRVNLLTLDDAEARAMGVHVPRLRTAVVLCATLVTAASVSVSGMIGWVGLVIPHLARRLVGSNEQYLLPASALLGASFLLWADDLARVLFTAEIPVGILTALIGAPFFLSLMLGKGEQM